MSASLFFRFRAQSFFFAQSIFCAGLLLGLAVAATAQDANRFTYLDEFSDPYYPTLESARLTTPQWIGEANVDAVITLGIDDMRDPARYEAFLRPILDRLKKIDGRAPVSIMTCSVDPDHQQLQTWLKEGVSLECHTIDHPCPCLNGGDFARAKSTYDRCVDLMNQIKGNRPVAFRFPCMDSLNTPSPRAFAEIVNQQTEQGHHLQISTSVTCLFTPDDPTLKQIFTTNGKPDQNRFKKYVPFPSFVNQIQNYPYPYLIGNQCWEFPCTIPDDWQGQNLQRPHNPVTVTDLKAAVDATVLKQGVANIIFHPHAWIRAEQIVEVIDHVDKKYGGRVKFLTFKECAERINRHLLKGEPVRHPETGQNNGVQLLDLNRDGFQDVVLGNQRFQVMRIWNPAQKEWSEYPFKFDLQRVRFGIAHGKVCLVEQVKPGAFRFWILDPESFQWNEVANSIPLHGQTTIADIRLRDLDRDGHCELIAAGPQEQKVYQIVPRVPSATDRTTDRNSQKSNVKQQKRPSWTFQLAGHFPVAIADRQGKDNGVRFVDLNEDQLDDIVISNDKVSAVYLKGPEETDFDPIELSTEIPRIVTLGKNGGVWFANGYLWAQHEHTHRLPDGVDRRSFHQILGNHSPRPRSPKSALKSFEVAEGFSIELMAAEPLVMDPIAIEWGIDGKLWVVEMADYPLGLDDRGKPGGRVRYLEDTDADGKYDKSTLFVDGIPFPTGVLPTNIDPSKPSCLITAAPLVVQAKQQAAWSEIVADPENVLLRGFNEGNQQHRFNGFSPGLDNWLYLANGDSGGVITNPRTKQQLDIRGRDLRIKPGDEIQLEAQTGQTQFGRHRDDWGNWFGCSNPLPLRHYILPDHYLKRNTHYRYPSPRIDIATASNTQLFPISRVLSHWSGYRPPEAGQPHRFTSACSTDFYRDDRLGPEWQDNVFTCEPVHNLVHRRIVERDGIRFSSRRPESESDHEFLASTDSWFRPTTVKTGPDGALWVVDMYRLVIEHPEWIDDQREKELFLRAGHDKGRIYRIVPNNKKLRAFPAGDWVKDFQPNAPLSTQFTNRLVNMLYRHNRWHNETAQRWLVKIGDNVEDRQLQHRLSMLAENKDSALTRLLALCVLDGRDEVTSTHLIKAFADEHAGVRRNAIRISERFLQDRSKPEPHVNLLRALQPLVQDPDPQVRMQLAFSLGYSNHPLAAQLLLSLGEQDYPDQYIRAAVFSSLGPQNIEAVIQNLTQTHRAEFVMALLELAADLGRTELVTQSLTPLFKSPPAKVTTRQLEMIVNCYSAAAKDAVNSHHEFKELAPKFDESVFQSIRPASSERRIAAAVRLISRSPLRSQAEKISKLVKLIGAQSGVELQRVALGELAQMNESPIGKLLIAKWRTVSPRVRSDLLGAILQRPTWTTQLLDAIESKQIASSEISALQKNQLLTHPDKQVAQHAAQLFETAAPSAKTDTIARLINQLEAFDKTPDLAQGKQVFEKHCATCHRIGDLGSVVGPDLLAIKNKSPQALVTALVDPNQAVEDKYRSYVIALDDGRQLVGLIQSETSSQIRIATTDGKSVELFRREIEKMKSTGKSLMPEGLEQEISALQMHHLLNFIIQSSQAQTSLGTPKSFPGNKPVTVRPAADGTLTLSASNCGIHGPNLVFESKYQNLGFWASADDQASWKFHLPPSAKFKVLLHYACPDETAGNQFELHLGSQVLKGVVRTTGSWDRYQKQLIGVIDLEKGELNAIFSPTKRLTGYLLDLKAIELLPVKE